jgi:glycosyltransferase involved in cell wall biosynthesis
MIRLLLLAYHFPPIGGAGAQRWLKFTKFLAEQGVSTKVVTVPEAHLGRWVPHDPELLDELPAEVDIQPVAENEPEVEPAWRSRAERWLRTDSSWSSWWKHATVETGLRAGADADVVVASMSPYQTAWSAQVLSQRLGRPWVADLRDPWAFDEMTIYPTALHRRLEVRRMRKLLGSAAAVVTTTPETAEVLRAAFPELGAQPVVSIPNGFDADDFAESPPRRTDRAFRIVHTGYLHTELGLEQRRSARLRDLLGGGVSGVDVLTRSHVFLLKAIDQLIADDPSLSSNIEVHLAGVLSNADREVAQSSSIVHTHGYVNHTDAVGLMRTADLLFLPMHSMPAGTRALVVPGKTYEYLAAEQPILAAVPDGDARDILFSAGNARICDPSDVSGIAKALKLELDRWRRGAPAARPAPAVFARYERRVLTADYAALLADVVGKTGGAPTATRRRSASEPEGGHGVAPSDWPRSGSRR